MGPLGGHRGFCLHIKLVSNYESDNLIVSKQHEEDVNK